MKTFELMRSKDLYDKARENHRNNSCAYELKPLSW